MADDSLSPRDRVPAYSGRTVDGELDELMAGLPAIAIEGPKSVGKTATASRRAATVRALDDPQSRALAVADLDRLVTATPPILIDEWQLVPPVWDLVRRAVDAGAPPGQFLLTGSASPRGLGTHSGAGRIVIVRMRPMSLAERWPHEPRVSLRELLTGARPAVVGHTDRRLEDYADEIVRSGYPGIRGLDGRLLRAQLDGYLQRIVDRDFPELGLSPRSPGALRRWMTAYAAATATTTSFEKIREASVGRSEPAPAKTTVGPYREVLERLFVLDDVPAWQPSRNQLARLAFPPKHHLADPALAARLLAVSADDLLEGRAGGPAIPRDGPLLGSMFESLVTLSVRVYAQGAESSVGHLRTRGGEHEVDLIVKHHDGRVIGVEVKLAATPDREDGAHLNWLERQIGSDLLDKVIVTTGTEAYRRPDDHIAVVPAALLGP